MRSVAALFLGAALGMFSGCGTSYSWRPSVPEGARTVSVPTFRNESVVSELGAIASRQILREFQREGTFKVRTGDDAAIEIQGVIKTARSDVNAYDRRSGMRVSAYKMTAEAEVSVIDKRTRKVLVDNRKYSATADYTAGQDLTTAQRSASGRVAEDLARQVVDDVLNLKW